MEGNRRRRAATFLLFVVLLLGGLGLLTADLAAGQQRRVQGIITETGNPTNLLAGVNVTLEDAHGQKAPIPFLTGADGAYSFSPTPGFYRVTVSKPSFFDNETAIFRFDNTANLIQNLEMEKFPSTPFTLTVHVEETGTMAPIDNATVDLFNVTMEQVVETNLTDAMGDTTFPVWAGTFQVWVEKDGFAREVTPITITMSMMITVSLASDIKLVGIATAPDGTFVDAGLVAFLYNTDAVTPESKRLIVADVTGSSYTFFAYAGTFTLIVDADGRAASITSITISTCSPPALCRIDRVLAPSPEERVDTVIHYRAGDWERLNLWRNLSFNEDSTFPGLAFAFVRNLRLQIDIALGDGDGTMSAAEREAFRSFLEEAGPKQVDTNGFFTTNSLDYLSDEIGAVTDYAVWFPDFPLSAGNVTVASIANYTVDGGSIVADQEKYFVNVSAPHDTELEVRVNTTYTVQVVASYERVLQTITGSVDISGYVTVVLDPTLGAGNFRVDMEVAKSLAGTARVDVVAPPDRFTVTNASQDNYTAVVPTNVSMTLSAEGSTDPNSPGGQINPDSDFTWVMTNATAMETVFGLRPNVTFSTLGNYSGNLTIVDVGGNITFRNYTLKVDGILPLALLENNVTGFGMNANNTTISINEGQVVEFFGGNSTDLLFPDVEGAIRTWRWDFDGDGIVDASGETIEWTFDEPGEFTVNLTAVDQAGHESVNATMFVNVADTSPPDVRFVILDENFQEVSVLVEQVPFFFDGSDTTDNFDAVANLTFAWDFGDGNTTEGVNVSYTYQTSGEFDVTLTATDQAGNAGNSTRTVTVGVDPEKRPDLEIEENSYRIVPQSPEESTLFGLNSVLITLNVTNKPDRAPANNVQVSFFAFPFGQPQGPQFDITAVFFDATGAITDNTLNPGETKRVEFTWVTGTLGNWTLRTNVTDPEEPSIFQGPRNSAERQVDIREAAWKQPLLIGSIVAIIVGIPTALFLRRRLRGRGRERITR